MTELLLNSDLTALWITLKLAGITTLILLILGTPLAWWLSKSNSFFKPIIEAIFALPLVLPPTVLGFYLLVALGQHGPFSRLLRMWGQQSLAFSFTGLIIGSVIYSLPFVIQPIQNAFSAIGSRPLEVAATLRASPWDRFLTVVLPLSSPGFVTATVLGFAHTVGEFGVVLMIGGNIPGKTQVLSIAIYDHVEAMEYSQAHLISAFLLIFSFTLLMLIYGLNKKFSIMKS